MLSSSYWLFCFKGHQVCFHFASSQPCLLHSFFLLAPPQQHFTTLCTSTFSFTITHPFSLFLTHTRNKTSSDTHAPLYGDGFKLPSQSGLVPDSESRERWTSTRTALLPRHWLTERKPESLGDFDSHSLFVSPPLALSSCPPLSLSFTV